MMSYRTNAIAAHDQISSCLCPILEDEADASRTQVFQGNETLLELNNTFRNLGQKRRLEAGPPDSLGMILEWKSRITGAMRAD